MTFAKRKITIQLQLNGDTFAEGGNTLELTNIRCRATIQSTIGGDTPCQGQMQLQIWGMRDDDMAKLSTLGLSAGDFNRNNITVLAGDQDAGMTQVFSGAIFSAFVDYNAQPAVCVEIQGSSTLQYQLASIAPSSHEGAVSVPTMLQAICASCTPPLNFVNNGVTGSLSNHVVGGDAMHQIADICAALGCWHDISNGTLTIWPLTGTRDNEIISTDSNSGMVGYPCYNNHGIDVVMEFNPGVMLGRQLSVKSSIPVPGPNSPFRTGGHTVTGATGTFYIYDVVHDLSAELPNGPWFTKAACGAAKTKAEAW
jgi:hypothetical protein